LFTQNNQLSLWQSRLALRLGGCLAGLAVVSSLVGALMRRRPPWPWIRSLPWSARRRSLHDAALLTLLAAPMAMVPAVADPTVLAAIVATLPLIALRGAAAIRSDRGRGVGGVQLVAEGVLLALAVALVPQAAALSLVLVPLAIRMAAVAEQRVDIGRWHELHHLAAGDSLSWCDG
jgi:hypothetical protein